MLTHGICALVVCALFLCGALVAAIWQPDEDTVEAQISRKSESHNNQITPFSNVNTPFSNRSTLDFEASFSMRLPNIEKE